MFGRGASSPGRGNVDGSIPGSPRVRLRSEIQRRRIPAQFIEGAPPYAAPGAIGYPPIDACGAIPGPDPIDIGGGAPAPTGAAGTGDIGGGTAPYRRRRLSRRRRPIPTICVGGAPIGGDGAFICIGGAPHGDTTAHLHRRYRARPPAPTSRRRAGESSRSDLSTTPRRRRAVSTIAGAPARIPGAPIATGGAPTPPRPSAAHRPSSSEARAHRPSSSEPPRRPRSRRARPRRCPTHRRCRPRPDRGRPERLRTHRARV